MARPVTPRPPLRPGLRIVLFASLALNLLVVGLVAGALIGVGRVGGHGGPPPRDMGMTYTRALSPEDRAEMRHELREAFRAARPERPDYRDAYETALELLRDEPFDRAAFEATLEAQFSGAEAAQRIGREVLVEHLSGMDAAARGAYADRLDEALEDRRQRHRERRERRKDRDGRDGE